MHAVPQIVLGNTWDARSIESFEFSYFRQHLKAPSQLRTDSGTSEGIRELPAPSSHTVKKEEFSGHLFKKKKNKEG